MMVLEIHAIFLVLCVVFVIVDFSSDSFDGEG